MAPIDILIVIVFAASLLFGFHKGIIAQLGVLGGIALGIAACRIMGDSVSSVVIRLTESSADNPVQTYVASTVANIIIFGIVFTMVLWLSKLVKSITRATCLGIADRVAGMLFSLFSWLLALSLAMNVWQMFTPGHNLSDKGKLNHGRAVRSMIDFAPDILGSEAPTQVFGALPKSTEPQSDQENN